MTFNSLFTLVEKNLKIFFRSRISSAIIILMPLIIVLFSGYGFDSTNLSGVSVAVYSDSYSNITNNILNGFEENGFVIKKHSSLEDCIDSVKFSKSQICVSFPPDLSYEGNNEEILFYVDYSRTNLAYTLINIVGGEVLSESSNLGMVLVQDLIDNLNSVKNFLIEEKSKLDSVPNDLNEIGILSNNLENPLAELESTITDLKKYGNVSSLGSITSDLNSIKEKLSNNSGNIEKINLKNEEVKSEISSLIIGLDSIVNSLDSIEIGNAEDLVSPIEFGLESITPLTNKREYFIPTVIALISLFGGILISSTFVLKNKKTRAYFRNFVTPTRDFTFVFSTFVTCLIILLMQFLLVFLGLYFVFGMNFFAMLLEILCILILSWSAFIFIGMFLGYIFRSEETIIFSAVLVASLLMFFSNLILPLENISGNLLKIASYNPFVLLENSLKKIYLFGLGFNSIFVELAVLGGFLIFFGVLAYVVRRMTKRIL